MNAFTKHSPSVNVELRKQAISPKALHLNLMATVVKYSSASNNSSTKGHPSYNNQLEDVHDGRCFATIHKNTAISMLATEASIPVREYPCMWTLSRDHRLLSHKIKQNMTSTTLACVARYLRRAQHQMLVLLLPLPNRLVQGYHKRYIAFVRLFQQKQLGDVVVLDLVVIPTEEEGGVMETSAPFQNERNKRGSKRAGSVTRENNKA